MQANASAHLKSQAVNTGASADEEDYDYGLSNMFSRSRESQFKGEAASFDHGKEKQTSTQSKPGKVAGCSSSSSGSRSQKDAPKKQRSRHSRHRIAENKSPILVENQNNINEMSLVSSKQKLGDKELKLLQLNGSRIRSEQPEFAEHHSLLKLDALRLTIATKVEGECDDNGLISQNIQNKVPGKAVNSNGRQHASPQISPRADEEFDHGLSHAFHSPHSNLEAATLNRIGSRSNRSSSSSKSRKQSSIEPSNNQFQTHSSSSLKSNPSSSSLTRQLSHHTIVTTTDDGQNTDTDDDHSDENGDQGTPEEMMNQEEPTEFSGSDSEYEYEYEYDYAEADNGNVAQEEDDDTNERKIQTHEEFHDSGLSNIQSSNANSSHISRVETVKDRKNRPSGEEIRASAMELLEGEDEEYYEDHYNNYGLTDMFSTSRESKEKDVQNVDGTMKPETLSLIHVVASQLLQDRSSVTIGASNSAEVRSYLKDSFGGGECAQSGNGINLSTGPHRSTGSDHSKGIDDNVSMGPSEDRQATARVNSNSTGRSSSETIKSRPSISNEKLVANIQQVSTHGNVGTDDECYEYDPQNESNEEEDESFYDEYTISNSFEGSRHGSAMDANVKDFDHDEDDEDDEDEDEYDDENEVEDEDEDDDESDNGMERNSSAKSGSSQNIGSQFSSEDYERVVKEKSSLEERLQKTESEYRRYMEEREKEDARILVTLEEIKETNNLNKKDSGSRLTRGLSLGKKKKSSKKESLKNAVESLEASIKNPSSRAATSSLRETPTTSRIRGSVEKYSASM